MKYKITIGDKVFDAERRDNGFYQLKCDKGDFEMNPDLVDALGAKIEEVKEPLRFEANVVWKQIGADFVPYSNIQFGMYDFRKLDGKKGKLTFVEELPAQCEHCYIECGVRVGKPTCIKCGKVKR